MFEQEQVAELQTLLLAPLCPGPDEASRRHQSKGWGRRYAVSDARCRVQGPSSIAVEERSSVISETCQPTERHLPSEERRNDNDFPLSRDRYRSSKPPPSQHLHLLNE